MARLETRTEKVALLGDRAIANSQPKYRAGLEQIHLPMLLFARLHPAVCVTPPGSAILQTSELGKLEPVSGVRRTISTARLGQRQRERPVRCEPNKCWESRKIHLKVWQL